ncbi:hypothetical protein MCG98_12955 [Ruminococcus sp. OA3]|uniref:hypothetical protein n=1 Tax=Ruminococcus sp. OA3 TaxID=2914164 RepID=UPI001F05E6ED|nr:hypothetical protein [Ruminococcus sp. OA3]MCH1983474.1 hypothetical protein [Ruminococcus sp. OA3]
MNMILGMEWYWWLVIVIAAAICIPLKIKFVKWWGRRQEKNKTCSRDKWGGME